MNAVTIDNLDIKVHERYAQDQVALESKYITESFAIAPHSESVGTSSIYASQWEILFEIHLCNTSWALFSPPPKYHVQRNKFFTYQVVPAVNWSEEEDGEEQDEEGEQDQETPSSLLNKILTAKKGDRQSHLTFEKEKTAILNLFDSVKRLNKLLEHVNSRKLQYQKG